MYVDPSGEIAWLIIGAAILFTPLGGKVLQAATSALAYVGMVLWAFTDLSFGNGNGAWADMNRIGWNPFNSDESLVFSSSYISFYKGVPVFLKNSGRSGSFYAILLNRNRTTDTLRHERGHNTQAMNMGLVQYSVTVGLPSWQKWGLCSDSKTYYKAPWETMADIFGGVEERKHTQEEIDRAWLYYDNRHYIIPSLYFW